MSINGDDPFVSSSDLRREPDRPVFPASYKGECSRCLEPFDPGDLIRPDGCGSWECAEHEENRDAD